MPWTSDSPPCTRTASCSAPRCSCSPASSASPDRPCPSPDLTHEPAPTRHPTPPLAPKVLPLKRSQYHGTVPRHSSNQNQLVSTAAQPVQLAPCAAVPRPGFVALEDLPMNVRAFAAVGITVGLALSACGGSDSSSTEGSGSTPKAATIRLWLNGEDTPQAMVDYATAEFAKEHPGSKVVFERQQWTGIVEKLTTSLSSSDAPDVVELGNTQAQAFEAGGALMDLSAKKADLGGNDLVQSLVEAGTYDGKFYATPYYGGARIVFYRKDLFDKSKISVPTTTQEFVDAGIKLKADNAAKKNFSGIYYPGKYWYAALLFVWDQGGDIATQENGKWVGKLASPESVAGL